MDHLPLPHYPTSISIAPVPLLATVAYDGKDFRAYPARNGWTITGSHASLSIKHNGLDVSTSEAGSMLQTWLFFGLLSAVTGEPCDIQTFTRVDALGAKELTTESLGSLVSRWSEKLISEEWSIYADNLSTWKESAYEHILLARKTTLRVNSTERYADLNLVCMSIAVLGEYLVQALKDIFLKRALSAPINQSWRVPMFSDCGAPLLASMLDKGWCPYKLAGLDAGKVMSIGKLWFFAHMTPPNAGLDHKGLCSPSSCDFMEVKKSTYAIAHEEAGCSCALKGPDPRGLAYALETGSIPILRVQEGATPLLYAEPYTEGMEYVAISHVWADGHGNPDDNTSPCCFLNSLTRRLRLRPLTAHAGPVRFWLDTLCVPRQPRGLKKLALSRLKEPYQLASQVLVMDSYLSGLVSTSMSTIEIVARVEASGWSQRLWTFKEGRLSGERIWFQFQDRAVKLYDLVQNEWRETFCRIPSLASHSVDLDILGSYNSSALWDDSGVTQVTKQVPYVRHSLSTRSTSHMEDEAICLVNIMGLPIEPILGLPDDLEGEILGNERMKEFWSLLETIPAGMALSMATRKLSMPGYRWAPASLMGDSQVRRWGGPQGLFEMNTAKSSDAGLIVELFARPICSLKTSLIQTREACQQSKHILFRLFREHNGGMGSFMLRDEVGQWYRCLLGKDWHQEPAPVDTTKQATILLGRAGGMSHIGTSPGQIYGSVWDEEAILATHDHHINEDGPTQVKAHRHVWLSKIAEYEAGLWERLWNLKETLSEQLQLQKLPNNGSLTQILDQHIHDYVREDPGLLELGKCVNALHNEDTSDEAVLKEFLQVIWRFTMLTPWCGTTSSSIERSWCIS
ncbi:Het domain-containing protein [Apiospora rasikravindrae]|uniref:Het domain-containing protein n=1 Tax=Apiospora rasikravindrae TaxID=990691 RepID=A0ABR1T0Q2_9PEZI